LLNAMAVLEAGRDIVGAVRGDLAGAQATQI
jgi:hypothetical protein